VEDNKLKEVLDLCVSTLVEELTEQGIPEDDINELIKSIMGKVLNKADDTHDWEITLVKDD